MKIKQTFTLFFLLICLSSSAQKYGISLNAGYHQGILAHSSNDAPFTANNAFSLGSGISRQLMLHIYPDSANWFFSSGLQHFGGNGVITASSGSVENHSDKAQYLSINSLRWISQFSYGFHTGPIDVNLSAGFILPLINRMREETFINDTWGSSKAVADLKNYTSFGFTGSLGISSHITPKIKLFCNADLVLLNSKVKSRRMDSYADSRGISSDDMYPGTAYREYIYRRDISEIKNNETVLKTAFNKDLPTDKLSYSQSYSSMGLQLGFLFLF